MLKAIKYLGIPLVFPVLFIGGCKNKPPDGIWEKIPGIRDITSESDNVYIGKLLSVGEKKTAEKTIEYEKDAFPYLYSLFGDKMLTQTFFLDFNNIEVEVQEVFKGGFQESSTVSDWIPHSYYDFLETDSIYLFMTCNDFGRIMQVPQAIIYDAVKILDSGQIEIYRLAEFQEEYRFIEEPPKDLEDMLSQISLSTQVFKQPVCRCALSDEQVRDWLSDAYRDPSGLYCKIHGVDNAKRFE